MDVKDNAFREIKARRIPRQNIIYRLIDREIWGAKKPGTYAHVARSFYLNIFPNFTVINVDKPPCFLRKFSPNGLYFVAVSADQTCLEIYRYKGCNAVGGLLRGLRDDFISTKYHLIDSYIKSHLFDALFELKCAVNVSYNAEQLNRECSLFTDDGKYIIVGSAAFVSEENRPRFLDIYTSNEAVTPNYRSPLEHISLNLINLEEGQLCDSLHYDFDKIYLSHNQGLYLYRDRLAVLSIQHQLIHVYLIKDGIFIPIHCIGRFCHENDFLLLSSVHSSQYPIILPFKEDSINSLKHRLLAYLFKDAYNEYLYENNAFPLRKFYMHFDQIKNLKLWKMQLLDEDHLLLKYASEDVVIMKTTEPNSQLSLFVVYNMVTTEVIAVYDNTSDELLYLLENFTDHFRNARISAESQFTCSSSNNVYAQLAVERFKQTIISAKYGGPTEATKRILAQLPISAQSFSSSPYLDLSLYSYDDKWVSSMERPKACGEHPIRFFGRDSGLLKFKMYAGVFGRNIPAARRLAAFIFHPTDPFAISVQRTNADYVVNFHLRNVYYPN